MENNITLKTALHKENRKIFVCPSFVYCLWQTVFVLLWWLLDLWLINGMPPIDLKTCISETLTQIN